MNIFESIRSSLQSITSSKMRSVLTMFGIVVGISSVMMITSVGEGYRSLINMEFDAIGLDRVNISTTTRGGLHRIETHDLLTLDDVDMLRQYVDLLEVTSFVSFTFGNAIDVLNNDTVHARVIGTDDAFFRIDNPTFIHGRPITEQDVIAHAPVTVIGEDFAVLKFGRTDVVGETIAINDWGEGLELTVIGVTESTPMAAMAAAFFMPQELHAPISLIQARYNGGARTVNSITAQVADIERLTQIAENMIRIIEFDRGTEGRYRAQSMMDILEDVDSVIGIFTMFMSIVAGISLLVGGIGVMNIMLVSVTERTREIGIRKSLGATNWNIQFQFLVEAVILTAIGGAIGILFGYLGGAAVAFVVTLATGMPLSPYISAATVGGVVLISALIGIVFGVYPAAKAARLDPIEALRFE